MSARAPSIREISSRPGPAVRSAKSEQARPPPRGVVAMAEHQMSEALSGWVEPGVPDDREDRLLPWKSVRQIAGISRTTAWRLQQTGEFPKPVAISANRVGWWESDLTAWKAKRRFLGRERPRPFRPPILPRPPARPSRSSPESATPTVVMARIEETPKPVCPAPAPAPRRPRPRAAPPGQIDFGF